MWTQHQIRAVLELYHELTPSDLSPHRRAILTDIERALDCLTDRQRAVIAAMYLVTNWTVREVAVALRCSHVAVILTRDRAIASMERFLGEGVTKPASQSNIPHR